MKNEQFIRKTETAETPILARKSSPFLQLDESCMGRRKIRIRLLLPRRESCLTRRAMIAALRAAELAEWDASGGDFLRSAPSNQKQSRIW
jgi:hypothetical protein